MANTVPSDNPFVDPPRVSEGNGTDLAFAIDSTLAVGKNASLTLGTDSLIVLGEAFLSLLLWAAADEGVR
jgi:sphingosine kinase